MRIISLLIVSLIVNRKNKLKNSKVDGEAHDF